MNARLQVSLDPELLAAAKERAVGLGISLSEYVRGVLARELAISPSRADPSAVFNLGDSGGADVARHKHAYVGEAASAE